MNVVCLEWWLWLLSDWILSYQCLDTQQSHQLSPARVVIQSCTVTVCFSKFLSKWGSNQRLYSCVSVQCTSVFLLRPNHTFELLSLIWARAFWTRDGSLILWLDISRVKGGQLQVPISLITDASSFILKLTSQAISLWRHMGIWQYVKTLGWCFEPSRQRKRKIWLKHSQCFACYVLVNCIL